MNENGFCHHQQKSARCLDTNKVIKVVENQSNSCQDPDGDIFLR